MNQRVDSLLMATLFSNQVLSKNTGKRSSFYFFVPSGLMALPKATIV